MVQYNTKIPNSEQLDFMHIQLKVAGTVVTGNLSEDLLIPDDPELLAEEISKYPSMLFYWSSVAEVAKRELERVNREFEVWFSSKYVECKQELTEEFGKSYVTDTLTKSRVFDKYRDEYEEWQDAIAKAEYRKGILSIAASAFKEKGQAMINLMSWKKQQMKADEGSR